MMPENFFGQGNDIDPTRLQPEQETSIENWREAIERKQIAFLPRATQGRLYWYAFAPTMRAQKELLNLLDAWIGPTFSDLPRSRGRLYPQDPFDTALALAGVPPLRFEVLPRGNGASRDEVRQTLLVLSRLVWKRPSSEFDAPRTTVEALDDLGHAIGARDHRIALACLRELEASADLDQSNLAFLRIRVYAGLGDSAAIFADHDLAHVLQLRRPIGITRLLQQRCLRPLPCLGRQLRQCGRPSRGGREHTCPGPSTGNRRNRHDAAGRGCRVHARCAARCLHSDARAPWPVRRRPCRLPWPRLSAFCSYPRGLMQRPQCPRPKPRSPVPKPAAPAGPDDEIHRLVDEGEYAAAVARGLAETPTPVLAALLLACARELEELDTRRQGRRFRRRCRSPRGPARERRSRGRRLVVAGWVPRPQRNLGWLGWLDALEGGQHQRRRDRLQPHLRLGTRGPFHRRQPPGLPERGRVGSTGRPRRCLHGGTFVALHGNGRQPNFASESSPDSLSARRIPSVSGCRPSRFWSPSQIPDQRPPYSPPHWSGRR